MSPESFLIQKVLEFFSWCFRFSFTSVRSHLVYNNIPMQLIHIWTPDTFDQLDDEKDYFVWPADDK